MNESQYKSTEPLNRTSPSRYRVQRQLVSLSVMTYVSVV